MRTLITNRVLAVAAVMLALLVIMAVWSIVRREDAGEKQYIRAYRLEMTGGRVHDQ